MELNEALQLGCADHESFPLRIRDGQPEALWLDDLESGWHRVPARHLRDWPEDGWRPASELPDLLLTLLGEGGTIECGNVVFCDFRSGLRPDGSLSPIGMTACDTYARRWADSGERDADLEARHPELADRFAEIRTDDEVRAFHLIPTPPAGPGRTVRFPSKPGRRPAKTRGR